MTDAGWSGTWHPFAEGFALPSEDELREMAASIEEIGQRSPCVMTPDGLGLDGRSRVAACTLLGIEPHWEVFDGEPYAYIVAANAVHRHLTIGQHAMAVAIQLVETGQRQNGRFARGSVPDIRRSTNSAWRDYVSKAGVVLDHDRALAIAVLGGDETLDAAYRHADDERKRRERLASLDNELATLVESGVIDLNEAERRAADAERIDALPDDLAARVRDGALDLDEAELIAREQAKRIALWAHQIDEALDLLDAMARAPLPPEFAQLLNEDHHEALTTVLRALKRRHERTKP